MSEPRWTLQEQLLLICLDPRRGDVQEPHFTYLLSGAALADLLWQKRISLQMGRVQVQKLTSTGDRAIDDILPRIADTNRNGGRDKKLSFWVGNLYGFGIDSNRVVKTLAERLVERGVLTAQEHSALWVVKWTTYPLLEPAHVQKLHRRIQSAIQTETPVSEIAPELAVLISLLYNGRALHHILSKTELYEREQRIAAIIASDPVAYAVGKALSDTLLEDESNDEDWARRRTAPVVIVRPPRYGRPPHHRPPHRQPRRRADFFPGARPDRHGVWSVESETPETEREQEPSEASSHR